MSCATAEVVRLRDRSAAPTRPIFAEKKTVMPKPTTIAVRLSGATIGLTRWSHWGRLEGLFRFLSGGIGPIVYMARGARLGRLKHAAR